MTSPKKAPAMPTAELVTITPQLAEEMLGKNLRNRNPRPSRVATLASTIRSGDWMVTGEGIKFDTTGRLIDGQHRLSAVVEAGEPVDLFVFRNLNPDVQMVIDTGAKRSAADALKFAGIPGEANVLAAMARLAIIWVEGGYRRAAASSSRREVTNTEVVEWAVENPQAADSIPVARAVSGLGAPISTVAFAAMTLADIDAEDAGDFFGSIANLRTQGKGDPIYTLLKRYELARAGKEKLSTPQHLFYIFRAWNAFRKGSELHQMKVGGAGANGSIQIPLPI
jgi:hypothetical protein